MQLLPRWWRQRHAQESDSVIIDPAVLSNGTSLNPMEGVIGATDHSAVHKAPETSLVHSSHPSSPDILSDVQDVHPLAKFMAIIYQLDFKEMRRLATRLRIQEEGVARTKLRRGLQRRKWSCKPVNPPLHGSFNVLFPIRFRDGTQWILKVPANGTPHQWDEQSASAMTSEVCQYSPPLPLINFAELQLS